MRGKITEQGVDETLPSEARENHGVAAPWFFRLLTSNVNRATIRTQTRKIAFQRKQKPRSCRSVAFLLHFTLIAYLTTT